MIAQAGGSVDGAQKRFKRGGSPRGGSVPGTAWSLPGFVNLGGVVARDSVTGSVVFGRYG